MPVQLPAWTEDLLRKNLALSNMRKKNVPVTAIERSNRTSAYLDKEMLGICMIEKSGHLLILESVTLPQINPPNKQDEGSAAWRTLNKWWRTLSFDRNTDTVYYREKEIT